MLLPLSLEGPRSSAKAGLLAFSRPFMETDEITVAGQRRTRTGLPLLRPWLPGRGDTFAVLVYAINTIIPKCASDVKFEESAGLVYNSFGPQ